MWEQNDSFGVCSLFHIWKSWDLSLEHDKQWVKNSCFVLWGFYTEMLRSMKLLKLKPGATCLEKRIFRNKLPLARFISQRSRLPRRGCRSFDVSEASSKVLRMRKNKRLQKNSGKMRDEKTKNGTSWMLIGLTGGGEVVGTERGVLTQVVKEQAQTIRPEPGRRDQ